jgi:hypothetical protein
MILSPLLCLSDVGFLTLTHYSNLREGLSKSVEILRPQSCISFCTSFLDPATLIPPQN